MTEKRFTAVYDDIIDLGSIYDSETERFILVGTLTRTELICNLLNELYDENKELKEEIGELEDEVELLEGKLWNCKHYNR